MASQKFKHSIENFRGLAILFVMLSHATSIKSLNGIGENLYFFVTDATAWFVFISGYLFFHVENNRFVYLEYLKKKLKYVLLPYLVFSVVAICIGLYFQQDGLRGMSVFNYALWSLLVGGTVFGPLWFIPMIAIFFLLAPLLHRLASGWMIYLAALIGMAVALFTTRPIENMNPVLSFVHFGGFYLLGMVVSINSAHIDQAKERSLALFLIAVGLGGFVLSMITSGGTPAGEVGFWPGVGLFNYVIFGKLSLLIAVLFLFERYLNFKNRMLGYLAEISFGLFFVHGFYKLVYVWISARVVIPGQLSMVAVELALVVGASIITVHMLKVLLKKKSRYVIGC